MYEVIDVCLLHMTTCTEGGTHKTHKTWDGSGKHSLATLVWGQGPCQDSGGLNSAQGVGLVIRGP